MKDIPDLALSVRQPWAFCLAAGWKDIENRGWRRSNPGRNFRGDFAIHASTGMTRNEYEGCADHCAALGFKCPAPADLQRGGIIGVARVADIVLSHDSKWFFGPVGLVITEARQVDFIPVGGQLGFFKWRPLLPLAKNGKPVEPAKWMLPPQPKAKVERPTIDSQQGRLL